MKGSKTCPSCNSSCGPRTKICSCGHAFEFKNSIKPTTVVLNLEKKETPSPSFNSSEGYGIIIPAGKCPASLSKGVEMFVEGIHSHSKERGVKYLPSVYEYWAGTIVDKFSDEGKEVIRQVKELAIKKEQV